MKNYLRVTEAQLKTIKQIVDDVALEVSSNSSYKLKSLNFYVNPLKDHALFVKTVISGFDGSRPFIDTVLTCIDDFGKKDDCANMFTEFDSKMTFYNEFQEFYIVDGKATLEKN